MAHIVNTDRDANVISTMGCSTAMFGSSPFLPITTEKSIIFTYKLRISITITMILLSPKAGPRGYRSN